MTRRLLCCLLFALSVNAAEFKGAVPNIAADGSGGFAVSFIDGESFRFVTIREDKVSAPREIAKGNLLVNRADFPMIALSGKTMMASWLTKNGHGSMLHAARSTDGGATWSAAKTPHPSMVSEFGFLSLDASGDAIWLDGRGLRGGVEGEGDMELHYAAFPFAKDSAIDKRVCDCCQTAMAMTSDGPVVAYRDRSTDEIRDIAIVRRTKSGWTSPKVIHADGWKITGCPVNGPQLDANGKRVAIAWFTAAHDQPRVYAAFSNDAGATFSAPLRVDTDKASGRVDVALLADGSAVVTWVAVRGEKSIAFARRVNVATASGTHIGATIEIGEARGFPRIAVTKENVGVVWAADDRVHFKTIKLP
jgi:hypothetical protein